MTAQQPKQPTDDQVLAALRGLLDTIADIIKTAGPQGVPGGLIYSALMAHGVSLSRYETMMNVLVATNRVARRGELYVAPEFAPGKERPQ